MFLAEDSSRPAGPCGKTVDPGAPAQLPGGKWRTFPNSQIAHHGAACCDIAHQWLIAFDFAQLNGGDLATGPRWMRVRSRWGPSAWPIHWCEALNARTVDCGVHAAMAHETFLARGLRAYRAQFVQRYSNDAAQSWRESWGKEKVSDHWIDGDAIYHEGNAVLVGENEVRFWDGSAGWWINPRQTAGYGSLVAVRIAAEGGAFFDGLRWGERRIKLDQWVAL